MDRKDDQWLVSDDDGWVYGRDGDAVCEAHGNLGLLHDRAITARERAERIANLPEMEELLKRFASVGTLTFDGEHWQCRCGGREWRKGEPEPENNSGSLFIHEPSCLAIKARELLRRKVK